MRVVLYAHHSLFEPALCTAHALSEVSEVHLLLEVPASGWQAANFATDDLPGPGLMAADPLLRSSFGEDTRAMWARAASFHLVVTGPQRARHPASVRLMLSVLNFIDQLQPDVVHLDDVDVAPRLALALAVRRPRWPLIVGCHDPEPHSGESDWAVKRLTRSLLFRCADAYLVHHDAGLRALGLRYPRVRGRTYAVRLAPYFFLKKGGGHRADATQQRVDVLLYGRITPYKGIEDLFRAAGVVAETVPRLHIVVAGSPVAGYVPPMPPSLTNGGRVDTVYRYVDNADSAELFERSTVVVCPYTDASQSGVVLTAYAFGCPVVATGVGGLPEYVVDGVTGLVVPPGDTESLASALLRCLEEPGLVDTLRQGLAEQNAAGAGWDRVASQLTALYAGVIGGHPGYRTSRRSWLEAVGRAASRSARRVQGRR